jgi:predicted O-methyltransferase YrrM
MENDTPNWFEPVARQNFETYLTPMAGKPNLRFIQVGVFAGHASKWLLDNILTDQSSKLLDIDTWEGSNEHSEIDFKAIHKEYLERVVYEYSNVYAVVASSATHLPYLKKDYSDFIYIDGDHRALAVQEDAENAWLLLKSGGILAFDDYLWTDEEDTPKEAVDRFIATHNDELIVLHHGYQVWVQKK